MSNETEAHQSSSSDPGNTDNAVVKEENPATQTSNTEVQNGSCHNTVATKEPTIHESWVNVFNDGLDLSKGYLSDMTYEWSPIAMCHIFELEDAVQASTSAQKASTKKERSDIVLAIAKHFKAQFPQDSKRPPRVRFHDSEIHLYCRTQNELQEIWSLPPQYKGVLMKRVKKGMPLPLYAIIYHQISEDFDEEEIRTSITKHVNENRHHFGVLKAAYAQFYHITELFEEKTFGGGLLIFVTQEPKRSFPAFLGERPLHRIYGRNEPAKNSNLLYQSAHSGSSL